MADMTARDAKLVQYLHEAHGKERELETSLQAHIGMATRPAYKKRLQKHLKETKNHARQVERRVKQLGGPSLLQTATARGAEAVSRGTALAKGPLHVVRGTGEEEVQLKNAITEHSEEGEEIARYTAIEALAEAVGDKETARLARGIRREEERMAAFLARQIPQLTRAVARAEIPPSERRTASRRRVSKRRPSSASKRTSGRSAIDRTRRHLDGLGVTYEVVEHSQAFTAASEASAAGVRPENAAKSVLLHDGEGYRLVVIQASDRLDLGKVRDLLEVGRASLRLVSEEELGAAFPGFELGAIPPLGEMLPAPEIVDRRLLDHDRVLCNGGDHSHSILLDPDDIVRASRAQVADTCQE